MVSLPLRESGSHFGCRFSKQQVPHVHLISTTLLPFSLLLFPFSGCVAPGVRISSLRWNLQNNLGRTRPSSFPSLEIASKSNSELSRMMDKLPVTFA